ncbi:MAG: hypothetical protein AAGK04_14670 [Planctomycetota bacterium]
MGLIGASSGEVLAAIDRREADRTRERRRGAALAKPASEAGDREDVVIISVERPEAIEPGDAEHKPGDPRDQMSDAAAYTPTGVRGQHTPAATLDLSV